MTDRELLDRIEALFGQGLDHAELRWRIWSLIKGYDGNVPEAFDGYPGGRRGFARDAGVARRNLYLEGTGA